MPFSSNLSVSLGNDQTVVYPMANVPSSFKTSAHGNAPGTSNAFLKNSSNKNAFNASNKGNAPNKIGNVPIAHFKFM